MLQASLFDPRPGQSTPPSPGGGQLHLRPHRSNPGPHVVVQLSQRSHSHQWPGGTKNGIMRQHNNYLITTPKMHLLLLHLLHGGRLQGSLCIWFLRLHSKPFPSMCNIRLPSLHIEPKLQSGDPVMQAMVLCPQVILFLDDHGNTKRLLLLVAVLVPHVAEQPVHQGVHSDIKQSAEISKNDHWMTQSFRHHIPN